MRRTLPPLVLLAALLVATLPAAAATHPPVATLVPQQTTGTSVSRPAAAPSPGPISLDEQAFLQELGAPAPQPEATGCTATVFCGNGTTHTCSGNTTCVTESQCFAYCDTTGFLRCSSPCP